MHESEPDDDFIINVDYRPLSKQELETFGSLLGDYEEKNTDIVYSSSSLTFPVIPLNGQEREALNSSGDEKKDTEIPAIYGIVDSSLNGHGKTGPGIKNTTRALTCFIPIAFLYICTFFALSRNFAGGYELVERAFPEDAPKPLTIIFGSLLGAGASYSPYHQISNGIHAIEKLLQNPNKKTLLKLFSLLGLFGFWSGISFAEMGASSFQKMLSTDWNLGDHRSIDYLMDSVFGMTLIAQTVMYTEKLYNLKLNSMWKEIKQSPRKGPLFLLNMLFSAVGVVTNQVFGTQAARKLIENDWACQGLGVISAIGPWGMNVASMNDVVKSASDSCCTSEVKTTEQISFSWRYLGWKIVLIAFIAALISAAPNLEFNIEANAGKSFWSYILIFFGVIYNVIPKAAATMRSKYKELKSLSTNGQTLLPEIKQQPPITRASTGSFSLVGGRSFILPPLT